MIGIFGLALVIAISIYQFATQRRGHAPACPPGQRLHSSPRRWPPPTLTGDANLNPPCTRPSHDPRALNICLCAHAAAGARLLRRRLDRRASARSTRSSSCPPASPPAVQFAAVAVNADQRRRGRADPLASLDDSGRLRPRRRGRQPLRRGDLPDGRAGRPRRHRRDRLIGDRWQSGTPTGAAGPALLRAAGRPVSRGSTTLRPPRASSSLRCAAEFPGPAPHWITVAARAAAQPAGGRAAGSSELSSRYRGRERRDDAHPADPSGLPGVLSPDRARPRRRPDPQRAGGGGTPAPRRLPLRAT